MLKGFKIHGRMDIIWSLIVWPISTSKLFFSLLLKHFETIATTLLIVSRANLWVSAMSPENKKSGGEHTFGKEKLKETFEMQSYYSPRVSAEEMIHLVKLLQLLDPSEILLEDQKLEIKERTQTLPRSIWNIIAIAAIHLKCNCKVVEIELWVRMRRNCITAHSICTQYIAIYNTRSLFVQYMIHWCNAITSNTMVTLHCNKWVHNTACEKEET